MFRCKNKYDDCRLKQGNWYKNEQTFCNGAIDDVYKCIYLVVPEVIEVAV